MVQAQVTTEQFLRLSRRLDDFAQAVNSEVVLKVFPVGSLFFSLTEANPSGYLGGNWERYAKGCCLVGVDPDDPDFSRAGYKVGTKTVALTEAQNGVHTHVQIAHTHTQNAHTHTQNAHTHTQNPHYHLVTNETELNGLAAAPDNSTGADGDHWCFHDKPVDATYRTAVFRAKTTTATNNAATATNNTATAVNQPAAAVNQPSGSGAPHNNVQPSVPVYIWVRVA